MSEYTGICVNFPKSARMAFVLYFPIVIPCLLESVVTYFNVYTRQNFLEDKKLDFFYSSCKYFISFFVLDLIFLQIRFQVWCYLWGPRRAGAVNLHIPCFSLLLLVAFVFKHNVDEKTIEKY